MNKLLSLVLSVCLLVSSSGPVAAAQSSTPVANNNYSDEELVRMVMKYYNELTSREDGSSGTREGDLSPEEDYQKFRVEYLKQLEEKCKGVSAQSEQGVRCTYAKKEENIREAYQIAIRKKEEKEPNIVLQQLSHELLTKLKEAPAFAKRFQKDGEPLDPYLQIFPLFYLAQGLDEQTQTGVEDVLQKKVLSKANKCANKEDTDCPVGDAAILAMLSNRVADAKAIAEILKKGYNHPQLGGKIVSDLGPALLTMCSSMGDYQVFSSTIIDIIENSESGNHTWGAGDFFSMEGWANLVDRWVLTPGVFSEGFQYGFYKNEEDKEFSNWFSAWGDLGQEIGYLAHVKKDSKAAAAAAQIVAAAHQKNKNHLLVLGMMSQGYYPQNSADWLKEKASNAMGDLDVPTRLYVREGIRDAYIGLGKSKEIADEDLHIYERGSLEYNEYMLDAYNLGVVAESLKITGRIIDAALLVTGVAGLASIGGLVRELWTLYRWRAPLKALVVIGKSIKSAGLGKAAYWAGKLGKFSKKMRFAELGLTMRQEILADAITSIMTKREAFAALQQVDNVIAEGEIIIRETRDGVQLARRSGNSERILEIPERYRASSIEDLEKGAARYRERAQAAERAGEFAESNRLQREAAEMERLAKQAREFGLDPKTHFAEPVHSPTGGGTGGTGNNGGPGGNGGINADLVEEQVDAAQELPGNWEYASGVPLEGENGVYAFLREKAGLPKTWRPPQGQVAVSREGYKVVYSLMNDFGSRVPGGEAVEEFYQAVIRALDSRADPNLVRQLKGLYSELYRINASNLKGVYLKMQPATGVTWKVGEPIQWEVLVETPATKNTVAGTFYRIESNGVWDPVENNWKEVVLDKDPILNDAGEITGWKVTRTRREYVTVSLKNGPVNNGKVLTIRDRGAGMNQVKGQVFGDASTVSVRAADDELGKFPTSDGTTATKQLQALNDSHLHLQAPKEVVHIQNSEHTAQFVNVSVREKWNDVVIFRSDGTTTTMENFCREVDDLLARAPQPPSYNFTEADIAQIPTRQEVVKMIEDIKVVRDDVMQSYKDILGTKAFGKSRTVVDDKIGKLFKPVQDELEKLLSRAHLN